MCFKHIFIQDIILWLNIISENINLHVHVHFLNIIEH